MNIRPLLFPGIMVLCVYTSLSCNHGEKTQDSAIREITDMRPGAKQAMTYCNSCHEFVPPERLAKDYWKTVLLKMSAHMGFDSGEDPGYGETEIARYRLDSAHIFPDTPIISHDDWQALVLYYLNNAPDTLDQGVRPDIDFDLVQFDAQPLPWLTPLNGLTYTGIIGQNQIAAGFNYQGDSNKLHIIDLEGNQLMSVSLPSAVVDITTDLHGVQYLACMGPFEADDTPLGTILKMNALQAGQTLTTTPVLTHRERPVHIEVADLDGDRQNDFLVSEFGKFLGGLYWYRQENPESFRKHILYQGPGALTTKIVDIDKNGIPDIYALISQGNEGIFLYVNQGNGNFIEKRIIPFPPYFGSVDFELFDFDGDGYEDILYINGDSGDFGFPPKPFHGIRFFKNMGDSVFEEKWFYPQQGSYDLAVADFDQDGDPDIACIGFFAAGSGFRQEGFLYLQNPGEILKAGDFKPYSFREAGNSSFMVMDHGDLDGDGDIDLLLGASTSLLSVSEKVQQLLLWQSSGGAIYFLENKLF